MPTRLTIRILNEAIQEKWPHVKLAKGKGYFYVYSDEADMGLKLAGLYTTSIDVDKINLMSLDRWVSEVEYVLRDKWRSVYEQVPAI